ncbi:hypothetical protein [Paraburkholderia azotifigens]|uniref:hypothetical protein n=1 Tax=Paraburkholderia azotifigens TaxID=2057004 RepID=UPI003B8A93EC
MSQAVGNRPFLTGIAGTLIASAMAGLTLATPYSGRADALNHARETSANLVLLISGDLARNVEIYDLSLQETVHRSQEPTVWLIAAADTQLYAAKAAGRNQVKSVDPTQAQPHDLHDRTDPAKR